MSFIFGNFISIFNIFQLNLLICIQKFIYKKKIAIFYYPKNRLVKNNISFIFDQFLNQKKFFIFYGAATTINIKNFFFIKQSYLKFIFNIDLFISKNIFNKFSLKSKKIYIHHDIYDTPLA